MQAEDPAHSVGEFIAHRRTYESFVRLTVITAIWLLSQLVLLAIGGVEHRWILAGCGVVVATIAAVLGMAIRGLDWRPGLIVLALLLLTLLFVSH